MRGTSHAATLKQRIAFAAARAPSRMSREFKDPFATISACVSQRGTRPERGNPLPAEFRVRRRRQLRTLFAPGNRFLA